MGVYIVGGFVVMQMVGRIYFCCREICKFVVGLIMFEMNFGFCFVVKCCVIRKVKPYYYLVIFICLFILVYVLVGCFMPCGGFGAVFTITALAHQIVKNGGFPGFFVIFYGF